MVRVSLELEAGTAINAPAAIAITSLLRGIFMAPTPGPGPFSADLLPLLYSPNWSLRQAETGTVDLSFLILFYDRDVASQDLVAAALEIRVRKSVPSAADAPAGGGQVACKGHMKT